MTTHFFVQVATPAGTVYQGDADCITLETEQGIMQVKPGHADLIGAIDFTEMRIDLGGEQEHILGRKGMLHVINGKNEVHILLGWANYYKHVSVATAREHLAHIDTLLGSGDNMKDFHVTFLKEEKIALERMINKTSA